ncbi:hypothetical protein ACOMHN_065961 [Nucella lapillus]
MTMLDNEVIKVGSDVDKERLQDTARLHYVILQLPVVKHKVAPVKTLESGDVRVNVDVSFNVGSVLSLNDAEQTMTCSVYIVVEWRDISLVWNPRDYSNVSMIEMSPGAVWMPTLMLINSRDPVNIMSFADNLFIYSNGTVTVFVYYKTVTLCTMDHSQFPYDTQTCGIVLESSSPCCKINLTFGLLNETDAVNLILQSDWELVSMTHAEALTKRGFPSMQLQLRRRTVYFTVCLVLPMVLTSYMNTLVFLLPVQCGERFSFLVTIFVSTSLFISFFKDVMPRGLDTVPATMKLLVGVLVESLLVLLATVLVMCRHHSIESTDKISPKSSMLTESSSRNGFSSSQRSTKQPLWNRASSTECQRQFCWDVLKLDRIFFLVAFIINTIFLAVFVFE